MSSVAGNFYKMMNEIQDSITVSKFELIQHYAPEFIEQAKKVGDSYMSHCPFPEHVENTPSFSMNFRKGIIKCFGCTKVFKNFLLFLLEYKNYKLFDFITMLERDGFIDSTEALGDKMEYYAKFELRRLILAPLEGNLDGDSEVFNRILLHHGGIGCINEKAINAAKAYVDNYLKNADDKTKLANYAHSKIDELTGKMNSFVLLSHGNYRMQYYHPGNPKQKYSNSFMSSGDNVGIAHISKSRVVHKLDDIKKDKDILRSIRNAKNDRMPKYIDNQIKKFFNTDFDTYNHYNNMGDRYNDTIIKILLDVDDEVNVYFGEGFFDMYSLDAFGIAYYTGTASYNPHALRSHLKKVYNHCTTYSLKSNLNLYFDGDTAGTIATVRALNEQERMREGMGRGGFEGVFVFDYRTFKMRIVSLLSVLHHMYKFNKKDGKTSEHLVPILDKMHERYKNIDILFNHSTGNVLLDYFENIENDFESIKRMKRTFPSMSKSEDALSKIKDFGDVVSTIRYTIELLNKIVEKQNMEQHHVDAIYSLFIDFYRSTLETSKRPSGEFIKDIIKDIKSGALNYDSLGIPRSQNYIFTEEQIFESKRNMKTDAIIRKVVDESIDENQIKKQFFIMLNLFNGGEIKDVLVSGAVIDNDEYDEFRKKIKTYHRESLEKKFIQYCKLSIEDNKDTHDSVSQYYDFACSVLYFIINNYSGATIKMYKEMAFEELFPEYDIDILQNLTIDNPEIHDEDFDKLIRFTDLFSYYTDISKSLHNYLISRANMYVDDFSRIHVSLLDIQFYDFVVNDG